MFNVYPITSSTFISKLAPKQNFGTDVKLYVSKGQFHDEMFINEDKIHDLRTLVRFDESLLDPLRESVLELFVSNFKAFGFAPSFRIHPLTKSFDDGSNLYRAYSEDTATWESWDVHGGDFNANYSLPYSFDGEVLKIELQQFVQDVQAEQFENFGLIIIQDVEVFNLAFNSTREIYGTQPKIKEYFDDFVDFEQDNVEYFENNDSLEGIKITPWNYSKIIESGDYMFMKINIYPKYKQRVFTDSLINTARKLENKVLFRIFRYNSFDSQWERFEDFKEVNTLSFDGYNYYTKISTKNWQSGRYEIQFRYQSDAGEDFFSERYSISIT